MNSRTTRFIFTKSLYERAHANAMLCEEVYGKFLLFLISHDVQSDQFALNPGVEKEILKTAKAEQYFQR